MNQYVETILKYMPKEQSATFRRGLRGAESDYFHEVAKNICKLISKAPAIYETDGKGDIVKPVLHYFYGNIDIYITEIDKESNEHFGYTNIGYGFEAGYVDLEYIFKSFPLYEYDKRNKRIIITDNSFKLKELPNFNDLSLETEARWKLVETAWELGISTNLLNVNYNKDNNSLYIDTSFRRKNITSVRDALNGYQKGFCFYCFDNITIDCNSKILCDIDHFFPHTLQPYRPDINFDGVWNLVLTCRECNRGDNGKFAKLPTLEYLERLHTRNERLIRSHHPLRETIILQTGRTKKERQDFLQEVYNFAKERLITEWSTKEKREKVF